MSGPLSGIRVIDATQAVLGPFAAQILGDMGADVIKIETPTGDNVRELGPRRTAGMGSYFMGLNRNKRSIALDLKRPAAQAAVHRLIVKADVFVHNMRIAPAKRLRLDYPTLKALHPKLIYASAGGYRKGGPRQDAPAYDDITQAESGLAALNGRLNNPKGAPSYVPTVIADKVCGMALASAVGMALFHRERTGEGQEVHVPMLETMVSFLLVEHFWNGLYGEPEKGLGFPRVLSPNQKPFATRDGHICVLCLANEQWRRLFAALDRPELTGDPRFATVAARTDNVIELYAILGQEFAKRTTAEWLERLTTADVPHTIVKSLEDVVRDPYLHETGFFERRAHPTEGSWIATAIPTAFEKTPGSIRREPPKLGEHTEEVLREAGLSAAEIREAMERG